MEWTGSMPCNVAITRCLLGMEINCLHSSSSPAWLRGRTYEPGGTWSDRPVSHDLWVANCCRPKIWTKYFWGKKYIFLSNWRGQAERLVDRRHWPSSWGLLSFLAPPWFWFKTSSLEYCVQRYFWQHCRVLGCGCLGHRGLLKIGARVSENFSCVTKCCTEELLLCKLQLKLWNLLM